MKGIKIPINGTNYYAYDNPVIRHIVGETIATLRKTLKAIPAPRGADGAIAILTTVAAAGTLSSAAAVPTSDFFTWRDTDASDENGSTILMDGYDGALTDTFTIPTANGSTTADLTMDNTERFTAGDTVYVQAIGYFVVSSITSDTVMVVTNDGATGNTAAGQTAASGAFVTKVPSTGPRAGRWMQSSAMT